MLPFEQKTLSGSYWDTVPDSVTHFPCVQDLLICCDRDLLVEVVFNTHIAPGGLLRQGSSKQVRVLMRQLSSAFDALCALSFKRKIGQKGLFLPLETFAVHNNSVLINRKMSAVLFALDAVKKNPDKSGGELAAPNSLLRYSWAFDPWDRVLASRIWLADLSCQKDRYLVLAYIFWEMVRCNLVQDSTVSHEEKECVPGALTQSSLQARKYVPSSVSEFYAHKAKLYGLSSENSFETEFQRALDDRLGILNEELQNKVCQRVFDLLNKPMVTS